MFQIRFVKLRIYISTDRMTKNTDAFVGHSKGLFLHKLILEYKLIDKVDKHIFLSGKDVQIIYAGILQIVYIFL